MKRWACLFVIAAMFLSILGAGAWAASEEPEALTELEETEETEEAAEQEEIEEPAELPAEPSEEEAPAADGLYVFEIDEDGVLWQYNGDGGKETIPDHVREIGEGVFHQNSTVTEVTIPAGVMIVGEGAFDSCTALTKVTIADGVTTVRAHAFSACPALTEVSLPVSLTEIGADAFYNTGLSEIYYAGSAAQWKEVALGEGALGGASVRFGDETPIPGTSRSSALPIALGETDVPGDRDGDAWYRFVPDETENYRIHVSSGNYSYPNCYVTDADGRAVDGADISSATWYDTVAYVLTAGEEYYLRVYASNGRAATVDISVYHSYDHNICVHCGDRRQLTGESDSGQTWAIDGDVLTVTGEGTVDGTGVVNAVYRKGQTANIRTLVLGEGFTDIPEKAFWMWSYSNGDGIQTVVLPESMKTIGEKAFQECKALTTVHIPDGVTSIGRDAFKDCKALEDLTLGGGLASVDVSAFEGCEALTEITIPGGLTEMGENVFKNCKALASATVEEGVTAIGKGMFQDCGALTEASLPAGLTSVGESAFEGCGALPSLEIPNTVTEIGRNAFHDCASLPSVTIPGSVTSVGEGAFSGCSGMTSVTIAEGVQTLGEWAFGYCAGLKEINLPASLTKLEDYAFDGCSGLERIKVAEGNTALADRDGVLFTRDGKTLLKYPEGRPETTYTVPAGVTALGGGSMYAANALTEVTVGDDVTVIGRFALNDCENLKTVYLGRNVKTIQASAFFDSNRLEEVRYAGTKAERKQIAIGSGNQSLLGAMWYYADDGIETLIFPETGETVASGICGQGSVTFYPRASDLNTRAWEQYWTDSVKWTLGGDVLTLSGTGSVAYIGVITDYSLNKVCAPWEDYFGSIGTVMLEDGITGIGGNAFRKCGAMKEVWIPNSVKTIDAAAFLDCNALEDVYFGGTRAEWKQMKIGANNTCLTYAVIHFLGEPRPQPAAWDITGDGKTDRADRAYLARALADAAKFSLPAPDKADVNGDGVVDRLDRIALARELGK